MLNLKFSLLNFAVLFQNIRPIHPTLFLSLLIFHPHFLIQFLIIFIASFSSPTYPPIYPDFKDLNEFHYQILYYYLFRHHWSFFAWLGIWNWNCPCNVLPCYFIILFWKFYLKCQMISCLRLLAFIYTGFNLIFRSVKYLEISMK